jgi:hypothetical protein
MSGVICLTGEGERQLSADQISVIPTCTLDSRSRAESRHFTDVVVRGSPELTNFVEDGSLIGSDELALVNLSLE